MMKPHLCLRYFNMDAILTALIGQSSIILQEDVDRHIPDCDLIHAWGDGGVWMVAFLCHFGYFALLPPPQQEDIKAAVRCLYSARESACARFGAETRRIDASAEHAVKPIRDWYYAELKRMGSPLSPGQRDSLLEEEERRMYRVRAIYAPQYRAARASFDTANQAAASTLALAVLSIVPDIGSPVRGVEQSPAQP